MRRSHSTHAQATASHCRLTSRTGEWLFTDATVRSPLTGCQVNIKATRPVLEVYKMAGYFPDSPRISVPLCFSPLHLFVISVYRTVLHHSSSDDCTSPPVSLTGTTLLGTYPRADPSLYKIRTRFTGFHLGFLILEGGTDSLSRNVGKNLSLLAT
jgi:hypothetical protein